MSKFIKVLLFVALATTPLVAGSVRAPEIDASAGAAALTLLAGGTLVLRSRRKR